MNCTTCNAYIPDGMIGCPACANKSSVRYFRSLQSSYVSGIEKGDTQLGLARLEGKWHIQMIGTASIAWCGRDTSEPSRRTRMTFENLPMVGMCQECVREVESAIAVAHAITLAKGEKL
jgi:hypothetical protein